MPIYEDFRTADGVTGGGWQLERARGAAGAELAKKLTSEIALRALVKATGLVDNSFLFEFHQHQMAVIGGQQYPFQEDKTRDYVALLGLCIDRFHYVDLPVPEKWIRELTDRHYSLGIHVDPWNSSPVSTWEAEFTRYSTDWAKLQSGRTTTYDRSMQADAEIYLDEKWKLRVGLGIEFAGLYLEELQKLLNLEKKATIRQTLLRNVALRSLVCEASRYSSQLKEIMYYTLKKQFTELQGTDELSNLCMDEISSALYGNKFNVEAFEAQIIEIYWGQLLDLQKDAESKKVVEIIKNEISGEVYAGIIQEVA